MGTYQPIHRITVYVDDTIWVTLIGHEQTQ